MCVAHTRALVRVNVFAMECANRWSSIARLSTRASSSRLSTEARSATIVVVGRHSSRNWHRARFPARRASYADEDETASYERWSIAETEDTESSERLGTFERTTFSFLDESGPNALVTARPTRSRSRTLFVSIVGLMFLGSLAQGASLSVIVRRLFTVAVVRFVFRRAYRFACNVYEGASEVRVQFSIKGVVSAASSRARLVLRGSMDGVRPACERAMAKFNEDRRGMLLIPLVAAFVGWFTNWLAVKMIFYPIKFTGIPWLQYVEGAVYGFDILQPLGIVGWQGIVPAKAAQMSLTMVTMVTEKLVNVQEVFMLLNPTAVSDLLMSEVPSMAREIAGAISVPNWAVSLAERGVPALPGPILGEVSEVVTSYLSGFVVLLQQQVDSVIDLKELVVTAMCTDRVVLVDLFQRCGAAELSFLVNSGLFFGFFLGVIQMIVWAFYNNPWSITIGGLIVGLATNWLALKCIFEPVEPVYVGPFKLQGLFLQRQQEVSGTFSDYLTAKVLKSEEIWNNMLNGLKGAEFDEMLRSYTKNFVIEEAARRGMDVAELDIELVDEICQRVVDELPDHVDVLHDYTDSTLGLQALMREKMQLMTPQAFERVLHPVFEQDETTLIISGAVLGAIAGYIQQVYSVKGTDSDDSQ